MEYLEYVIVKVTKGSYSFGSIKLNSELTKEQIIALMNKQYGDDWKLYELHSELKSPWTLRKERLLAENKIDCT